MNSKKVFALAKERGIEPFELKLFNNSKMSIHVYMGELEQYTVASDGGISGRGIYQGKLGSFTSDKVDNTIGEMICDQIISNAEYGLPGNNDFFLKNGMKYKRVHNFHEKLDNIPSNELIALAKKISLDISKGDERIDVVQVDVEYNSEFNTMENSNGLHLKSKDNYMMISADLTAKSGEEVQSGFNYAFVTDLSEFNEEEFVKETIAKTVSQFGSKGVKTGKYDVVFNSESIGVLTKTLMEQLSAYEVEHHLSLFENKVGEQVLSKKLTILNAPLAKTIFDANFDSEGYPTSNYPLIEKGVLKTYMYDLETAAHFNTTSTGNGHRASGKIVPGLFLLEIKKGRTSFEEMISKMNKGVYITVLHGVGTGINPTSGDYSLQAGGYLIENGKITTPISLMTVAGNLLKDLNRIGVVGNDSKLNYYMVKSPSVMVKKLSISGE